MSSNRLRQLNAYPEIETQQGIDNVKAYVEAKRQNRVLPAFYQALNTRQKKRYEQKYGEFFEVIANKLTYEPAPRISMEVVEPPTEANKERILTGLYKLDDFGMGSGINAFYYKVCTAYLGITRKDVTAFLHRQGNYYRCGLVWPFSSQN